MDDKELEELQKLQKSLETLDNLNANIGEETAATEEKEEVANPILGEDDISDDDLIALLEATLAEELMNIESGENNFDINMAPSDDFSLNNQDDEVSLTPKVSSEPVQLEKTATSIPTAESLFKEASSPTPKSEPAPSTKVETQRKEEIKGEAPSAIYVPKLMSEEEEQSLESLLAQTLANAQGKVAQATGTSVQETEGKEEDILEQVERSLLASVVKSVENSREEEEKEEKPKRQRKPRGTTLKKAKKKYSAGLLVSMAATAVLAVTGGFFVASYFTAEEREYLFEDSIHVSSPNVVSGNNSNFIFVNETRGDFSLSRIVLDSVNTTFFFDKESNWENYSVSLMDDLSRSYNVHHNFFANLHPNMLIFEALQDDVAGAILTITNNITREESIFPLEFVGSLVSMPARHISQRSTITLGYTDFSLTGGYFTPVRSVVYYAIEGYSVPTLETIFLTQGATNLSTISHTSYDLGTMRMGRLEFPALNTLSGTAYIRFPEAHIYQQVNQYIDVSSLLTNNPENAIHLNTNNGELILSRMARRSSDFIMVLHGNDLNGNRIVTRPDANLVITTATNEQIVLNSEMFSGPNGTDIIFAMPYGAPLPTNITEIHLALDGIYFTSESATLSIDMDNLLPSPHLMDGIVINAAASYLTSLGYDSAKAIMYNRDTLSFNGIFSVRFGESVTMYYINGHNTHADNWEFERQVLEVWFR